MHRCGAPRVLHHHGGSSACFRAQAAKRPEAHLQCCFEPIDSFPQRRDVHSQGRGGIPVCILVGVVIQNSRPMVCTFSVYLCNFVLCADSCRGVGDPEWLNDS